MKNIPDLLPASLVSHAPMLSPAEWYSTPYSETGRRDAIRNIRLSSEEVKAVNSLRTAVSESRGLTSCVSFAQIVREALALYTRDCEYNEFSRTRSETLGRDLPIYIVPAVKRSPWRLRAGASGRTLGKWLSDCAVTVAKWLDTHRDCHSEWESFVSTIRDRDERTPALRDGPVFLPASTATLLEEALVFSGTPAGHLAAVFPLACVSIADRRALEF